MKHISPLIIDKTAKTPEVIFDLANNIYQISGRSLPENVIKMYEPVLQWINDNFPKIKDRIVFEFKIDYLNSASTKMISLILQKLEGHYNRGIDMEIKWYYNIDDEDIKDEGELNAKMRKVPIQLIPIEDD